MIAEQGQKPVVASLCGTFLKPEMQSVYRQITGLQRFDTVVLTERRLHPDLFCFEPVVVMQKRRRVKPERFKRVGQPRKPKPGRARGNFVRRFFYKHLLGVWPPPVKVAPPPLPAPATPAALGVPPAPELPVAVLFPSTLPDDHSDAYDLVDLLRASRAQLAHVYYGHKAVKYLPMLRRWGGPMIVSFHGMDVTDGAYKPGDPVTLADVFAHARLVLARSESLLARLAALGCPPDKLRLNRTAIPLQHLASSVRCPPPDGRWLLLQACRLIAKKGIFTTLRAMREIVSVWPHCRLVLAGDGPLAGEIRALAAELGLQHHVELAGWCSQEQLIALYREAHIFLHPSEMTLTGDQEGIPNALLEAMATGLPAVATFHGGIPEAVTHGVDGLLVPEKSPGLLATAILSLQNDPDLFRRLSGQAAANIREKFGAARQLQVLEGYYAEAIEMGRGATV